MTGLALVAVLALVGVVLVVQRDGGGGVATADQVRDQAGPTAAPEQAWQVALACGTSGTTTVGDRQIDTYAPEGCELTADEERAYVVTRDGGTLQLTAYARSDGEQEWQVELSGEESYPLVLPGLVLADGYDAAGDDLVVAVDAERGTERWRTPGAASGRGDGRTTVVTRFDDAGARLAAVSLADGTDRWQRTGDLLAVCPDVVLVATGSNVLAYDLTSGEERWRDPKGGPVTGVCSGDEAYVVEGDELTARAAANGEERWHTEVAEDARLHLLHGVVVAATTYEAVAHDRGDGGERWTLDLSDRDGDGLLRWVPVGPSRSLVVWGDRLDLVHDGTGERLASEAAGDRNQVAVGQGRVVRIGDEQAVALDLGGLERAWACPVAVDAERLALGGGTLYVAGEDTLTAYR